MQALVFATVLMVTLRQGLTNPGSQVTSVTFEVFVSFCPWSLRNSSWLLDQTNGVQDSIFCSPVHQGKLIQGLYLLGRVFRCGMFTVRPLNMTLTSYLIVVDYFAYNSWLRSICHLQQDFLKREYVLNLAFSADYSLTVIFSAQKSQTSTV